MEVEKGRCQSVEEVGRLIESLVGVEKKLTAAEGHLVRAVVEGVEAFKQKLGLLLG